MTLVNPLPPTIPDAQPHFYVREIPVFGDAVLSPMDGYSDLPFRSFCRELGSAMSYTEFVNVNDILHNTRFAREKLAYKPSERPLVFQIYGHEPQKMLEAALRIQAREPDIIDINMGCPAKAISNRGAGVGLMRTPDVIAEIFRLLTTHLDVPVTGKIRLGWDESSKNYLEVAKIVEDNGGQLLAVHGRTREQAYNGEADWDAIGEIVDALSIPVLGNGDIEGPDDIARMKAHTGCVGVMIGRATIKNPWIFAGLRREDVPPEMVRETMLKHLVSNQAFYGEERGLVLFRKFAARYLIPYRITREVRKRLLQSTQAEEFIMLLDDLLAEF
jgi:nifR3 family TIM-barrel protein